MTFDPLYEKQHYMSQENNIEGMTLPEKVKHVLAILKKGSPDEIAMEIMEMQGVASEESVAELTVETTELLEKLCEEGVVVKVKEPRQKVRYRLPG
jgi:hypothetical protein